MGVYILHIETATPVCSVALGMDGKAVAVEETEGQNLHASHLNPFIVSVLEKAGIGMADLHAVAVGKGPGSYTGLRIGVSAAKGLCYALGIPLVSVDTLDGMFWGFLHSGRAAAYDMLLPMIDARRMEVYTAAYDPQGNKLEDTQALVIDQDSFAQYRGKRLALFGSGADKFADAFAGAERISVVPNFKNSAEHLCSIAFRKYQNQAFEDLAGFEPFYLKDFMGGHRSQG